MTSTTPIERKQSLNRYWMIVLLFVVSTIPQILMLPLFGSINLLFLILLWLVLCAATLFVCKFIAIVVALMAAAAMAMPPVPNYVWPSNTGVLHFRFIGWSNVSHALYGAAFFFVFYLILFELAALFTRKTA